MENELRRTVANAVIATALVAISGCGHKGEVEDLIKAACPSMRDGGSLQFVSYSESKDTDWGVRTFSASGKVRWTRDRFHVVKTLKAYRDLPEVVITSEAKELKEGVHFSAVFYRGRTDKKGSASVRIPKVDSYTEEGLERKYPQSYIHLPNGDYVGRKFDKKKYKELNETIIKQGNAIAKDMADERLKSEAQIDKELTVDFRNLNEEDLNVYISRCDELQCGVRVIQRKIGDVQSDLEYFCLFPIEDMGQDEAKKCQAAIVEQNDLCEKLYSRITNRCHESNSERDIRERKGVRFVRGVKNPSVKQKNGPITVKMPTPTDTENLNAQQDKQEDGDEIRRRIRRSISSPRRTSRAKTIPVQQSLPKVEQPDQNGTITIRMPVPSPAPVPMPSPAPVPMPSPAPVPMPSPAPAK